MAAITPIYLFRFGPAYGLRYRLLVARNASLNDTITVNEMDVIKDTVGIRLDAGSSIACSEATNVVTISGALTDVDCLILVSGT